MSKNVSLNYGTVTANVIKDFQKAFNLETSGNADEATLNKIDELLNSSYSIGQKGNHVRELKQDLTKLGFGNFPKKPSKTYGTVTANVVKEFQAYAKLPQTGVVDQKTLDKIKDVLSIPYKKGDRGIAIVQLKKDLTKIGYGNFPKNPSVSFGKVTEDVVKEFQKDHGLTIDGIVGKDTLDAIPNSFRVKVNQLVNVEREKRGLPKLKTNDTVMKIAQDHSIYMSNVKYEHGNYGDSLKANGINYRAAAENIARGYSTPERVVNAWMNSDGHRKNILNPKYSYIGIGYTDDKNMWTQIFYGE